ncbi:MAG: amino acid adenylation domain-containing protein, partial [bacterium]|nr:amino acid adenylation domain-containing protein [bacterium]
MTLKEISSAKTRAAGSNVREREFWLEKLSGDWTKTIFPYDSTESVPEKPKACYHIRFGDKNYADLMRLRNGSDQRLFMILAAQLVVLLHKYTGSRDIILGTAIVKQEIEGDFINTVLTLRNRFEKNTTFKELIKKTRQTIIEAAEHQNYPIEVLLHKLNLPAASAYFPLFDVTILLENIHDRSFTTHLETNLDFIFRRTEKDLELKVEYNGSLYEESTVQRIAGHFKILVDTMTGILNTAVPEIAILSDDERKKLLHEFNDTAGEYPKGKTIHRWFEEQVLLTPEAAAVTGPAAPQGGEEVSLTYSELNAKANRLARYLRSRGVTPDSITAVMAERTVLVPAAILAVLKAGGAYLPIDVNYPEERKKYMLTDSGVPLALTDGEKNDFVPQETAAVNLWLEEIYDTDETNLEHITEDTHLVYLVYTSGSTGKPKGVMLEHKNLVNLMHFTFNQTGLDCSKVIQFHAIGFDVAFYEIFCALLSGGQLLVVPEEIRGDIPGLFELVERNEIKSLFLPMSFLRIIFNEESYASALPSCVEHIETAGEQVVINTRFRRYLKENNVSLHNHYGPAETHIVTALTVNPEENIPELPSIGKPVLNTRIHILDSEMKLLPVGVPGELYIGGVQVSRGYFGREELTEEKYINDPFSEGGRLYRSGDLARWLENGAVEFLGRIDKQVKIRGFRIEPGEIESRLLDIDMVKDAAVIDHSGDGGEKYLCAYVVSDEDISATELRELLAETLPDYMIPAYFLRLDEIPLSANGKVRRDALPSVEEAALKNIYIAPRSPVEKQLCSLWADILGLEKNSVGIDNDFFELGGHSLKATILITKIQKMFGVRLSLGEVFS